MLTGFIYETATFKPLRTYVLEDGADMAIILQEGESNYSTDQEVTSQEAVDIAIGLGWDNPPPREQI